MRNDKEQGLTDEQERATNTLEIEQRSMLYKSVHQGASFLVVFSCGLETHT